MNRLAAAIESSAPATASVVQMYKSMTGLDVLAFLGNCVPEDFLVIKLLNEDSTIKHLQNMVHQQIQSMASKKPSRI